MMEHLSDSTAMPNRWWHPLWEFCTHIVVGTGLFLLIAAPAVFLNLLVSWLEIWGVTKPIVIGLVVAEYALFIADIILFLVFVGRAAWRSYRRL